MAAINRRCLLGLLQDRAAEPASMCGIQPQSPTSLH